MDPAAAALFHELNKANMEMMKQLLEGLQSKGWSGGGQVDRGVAKPMLFIGEDTKFGEWLAKLHAYSRIDFPNCLEILEATYVANAPILDENLGEPQKNIWKTSFYSFILY